MQLPTVAMQAFHDGVNWSQPDAGRPGQRAFPSDGPAAGARVSAGRQSGTRGISGQEHPARVADQFETMIGRASALPDVLPELRRYLLEYPRPTLDGADSFFYWEKVAFGLRPTIRVNHAVIYRGRGRTAISASWRSSSCTQRIISIPRWTCPCASTTEQRHPPGFYLLTLKGSQQEGLTGVKGSMLRRSSSTRRAHRSRPRSPPSNGASNPLRGADVPLPAGWQTPVRHPPSHRYDTAGRTVGSRPAATRLEPARTLWY